MKKQVKSIMNKQLEMVEAELTEMEEQLSREGISSKDIWEFHLYMVSDKMDFLAAIWTGEVNTESAEEKELENRLNELGNRLKTLFELIVVNERVVKAMDGLKEGQLGREEWEEAVRLTDIERALAVGVQDQELMVYGKLTSGQLRTLAKWIEAVEDEKKEEFVRNFLSHRSGEEDLNLLERWIVGKTLRQLG